jgi:hypothetical protein
MSPTMVWYSTTHRRQCYYPRIIQYADLRHDDACRLCRELMVSNAHMKNITHELTVLLLVANLPSRPSRMKVPSKHISIRA